MRNTVVKKPEMTLNNAYLHCLVEALGKEHGNTSYALDCEETPEARIALNE